MNQKNVLATLLVLALVLLDLVVWDLSSDRWWPALSVGFLMGMAFSQAGLLALWLAAGRTQFFIRATVACVVVCLLAWAVGIVSFPPLGTAVIIQGFLVFGVVIHAGWKVTHVRIAEIEPLKPGQFSIAHLFAAITLASLMVAAVKWFGPTLILRAFPMACVFASLTILLSWSLLVPNHAAGRWISRPTWPMWLLISFGIFVFCDALFASHGGALWRVGLAHPLSPFRASNVIDGLTRQDKALLCMLGTMAVTQTASVLVLRIAGYQVRHNAADSYGVHSFDVGSAERLPAPATRRALIRT